MFFDVFISLCYLKNFGNEFYRYLYSCRSEMKITIKRNWLNFWQNNTKGLDEYIIEKTKLLGLNAQRRKSIILCTEENVRNILNKIPVKETLSFIHNSKAISYKHFLSHSQSETTQIFRTFNSCSLVWKDQIQTSTALSDKSHNQGIIPWGPNCIRLKHKPDCCVILWYHSKAQLRIYFFKLWATELTRNKTDCCFPQRSR